MAVDFVVDFSLAIVLSILFLMHALNDGADYSTVVLRGLKAAIVGEAIVFGVVAIPLVVAPCHCVVESCPVVVHVHGFGSLINQIDFIIISFDNISNNLTKVNR